jgi:hypothetical protein
VQLLLQLLVKPVLGKISAVLLQKTIRSDDNSAKLKEPSIATVADVVKRGAKPAEPMPKGMKEEEEVEGEVVAEAEEETAEEEVVPKRKH